VGTDFRRIRGADTPRVFGLRERPAFLEDASPQDQVTFGSSSSGDARAGMRGGAMGLVPFVGIVATKVGLSLLGVSGLTGASVF
jgi:hypothetical protein